MIYMESDISSWMAQVTFFSSWALILIFKVKLLTFYLFCKYLVNGEESKHYHCHQIGSHIFDIEKCQCKCCASWPWPTFQRSRILKCEYLVNGESKQKRSSITLQRLIFAINGTIANIVLSDLDLIFQGQTFKFWHENISKTVRASENANV